MSAFIDPEYDADLLETWACNACNAGNSPIDFKAARLHDSRQAMRHYASAADLARVQRGA